MTFPYKTAVITGASAGIGREMAIELARKGCAVGLLARREDELTKTAEMVRAAGGKAVTAVCDVAKRESILLAMALVRTEIGAPELVIANAGIAMEKRPLNFDAAMEERLMQVNFMGVVDTIYAALPDMVARKSGHVVAISSLASFQGLPANGAYCASKAALNVHMEALRLEMRPLGIAVTTICPGFIYTDLIKNNKHPMPFIMSAEKAARKIIRAIARKRRTFKFPWPISLAVALGHFTPRWLYDRLLTRIYGGKK
ncbi:MAG: SDR family NAD(P)-dependent oxidoreductase [Planctomycetes bacterium]|nr:SDR family NAD(P)-dependent oxidoreductase [Planctomycetota bacterium]